MICAMATLLFTLQLNRSIHSFSLSMVNSAWARLSARCTMPCRLP